VISKKEKNTNPIEIGKSYKFKLLRYFENQLSVNIEYKEIYDVMLGAKTIGILSLGWFNYLFVSPNLNSLNYIDSLNVDIIEKNIKKKDERLQKFICDFLKTISFNEYSNNLRGYVDSSLLMASLKTYSIYGIVKSPTDIANRKIVQPPRRIPYLNWERYNIDDKNFNSLFWGMLENFYNLPIKDNPIDFDCKEVHIKTLYFYNDISTIRIKWKLPSKETEYVAIVSIREFEQTFKIIGFNKTTLENYLKYNNNSNK